MLLDLTALSYAHFAQVQVTTHGMRIRNADLPLVETRPLQTAVFGVIC